MKSLLLAVIGKPVLHSKSPAVHNAALRAAGIPGHYIAMAPSSAKNALEVAKELGISGINITSPYKEDMAVAVDGLSQLAKGTKSVNTLVIRNSESFGYNTDIAGIKGSFVSKGIELKDQEVVVLGAGGACRAAIVAFQDAGAIVTIANRTVEKARALAQAYNCKAVSLEIDELVPALERASVILNVTSTAERVIPRELIKPSHIVMDAIYAKPTVFTQDAIAQGATVIPGKEWLIFHGLEVFKLFTGKGTSEHVIRTAFDAPTAPPPKRISIVGMMGSGKSSTARALAEKLNWKLVELDDEISRRAGKSIPEIFSQDGEAAFRDVESTVLKEAAAEENIILSCGGGIVLKEENRKILSENTICVWLWAKSSELAKRVGTDPNRPLLAGGAPEAKLQEILNQRLSSYANTCRLLLPTEGLTPSEAAERILYETSYVWDR